MNISDLHKTISAKGYLEQERQVLFSGLYGSKKLTKPFIGTFNNQIKYIELKQKAINILRHN